MATAIFDTLAYSKRFGAREFQKTKPRFMPKLSLP
jgi:hypothetical protein